MGQLNPTLCKSYTAGAAIAAYRIVKLSADKSVVQGAAVSDLLLGVTGSLAADSAERVDVILSGIAEVEYGGNVTRGDKLTSDANGKATSAAPAAGVNNQIIGVALESGVAGDIGAVLIAQSVMQGA
jgi:hypothetical protein